MAKSRNRCFVGSDTSGYKKLKPVQLLPLPADTTVMVVDTDEDDTVVMMDSAESNDVYVLALTEDGCVYPYEISAWGGFDVRASVVPVRYCSRCGKRMHMSMCEGDIDSLSYDCDCGKVKENCHSKEGKANE